MYDYLFTDHTTALLYFTTTVLVGLYEEPERPQNAVDYIKRYMGAPTGIDVEALKAECEQLRKDKAELEETVKSLNEQVRGHTHTHSLTNILTYTCTHSHKHCTFYFLSILSNVLLSFLCRRMRSEAVRRRVSHLLPHSITPPCPLFSPSYTTLPHHYPSISLCLFTSFVYTLNAIPCNLSYSII